MNVEEKHFYSFKWFRLNVEERQLLLNGELYSTNSKGFRRACRTGRT